MESLFDLLDFDLVLGTMVPKCTTDMGNILLIIIIAVPLVGYILSKDSNACLQLRTTKQMISLRLEHQKMNKKNDQLKACEPGVVICERHKEIQQKDIMSVNITQRLSKNCKNSRVVAESSANAFNFDHISQLG